MPKTTFNSDNSIDFIQSIAAIAQPFNSTLLDKYPEYIQAKNDDALKPFDERTRTATFLGALELIGQAGCKFLYDKVINYIDDVSNVDTCKLDALYSMAKALQVPYKSKSTLEFLGHFTNNPGNDVLELLLWIMSCNVRNSRHIIKRLALAPGQEKFINSVKTRADLFDPSKIVAQQLKSVLRNIFKKSHLMPAGEESPTGELLINYMWNFLPLAVDVINSKEELYTQFIHDGDAAIHKIDFGKYNFTIHEHTCAKLIQLLKPNEGLQLTTNVVRKTLPFLFDSDVFDPISATIDVIFDNKNTNKYTETQREQISICKTAINTTGHFILNSYDSAGLRNINQINKLNSYIFADERSLNSVSENIKLVLNVDILDYITVFGSSIKNFSDDDNNAAVNLWWESIVHEPKNDPYSQFRHIEKLKLLTPKNADERDIALFDLEGFVSAVYNTLYAHAEKITRLREDLKLLTLRNAYKGTNAIIQLSTAEYLNEHLPEIIDNTIETSIPNEQRKLRLKSDYQLTQDLNKIYEDAVLDTSDVKVVEYWDTTEYFGRTKNDPLDLYPADWNTDSTIDSGLTVYGNTSTAPTDTAHRDSSDIVRFYVNTLNLPLETLTSKKDTISDAESTPGSERLDYHLDLSTDEGMDNASNNLIRFLRGVYNSGIYDKILPDNIQDIFSGKPNNSALRQFYINYKTYSGISSDGKQGVDRISKQVHPYIWNFMRDTDGAQISIVGTSGTSGTSKGNPVSVLIQDISVKLLEKLIAENGNILDQWRLDIKAFTDDSNYWTRYEAHDHSPKVDVSVLGYDGYTHPLFARELAEVLEFANDSDKTDILSLPSPGPGEPESRPTIYHRWYRDAGGKSLREDEQIKENKILEVEHENITRYITKGIADDGPRRVMQNYSVDDKGTAFGVDVSTTPGRAVILYKEVNMPFMRPLRQVSSDESETQLGITIIDSENTVLDDFSTIEDIPYISSDEHFPNIIVTEDGQYVLIRVESTKLALFRPTKYINEKGMADTALCLENTIDLREFLDESGIESLDDLCSHIAEAGVKTIRDKIVILLTRVVDKRFLEYILTIGPKRYSIVEQEIECHDNNAANKLTAGLTLMDSTDTGTITVAISTFGVATDIPSTYNTIQGVKSENAPDDALKSDITGITDISDTSFDIFNQFIHMFVNSTLRPRSASEQSIQQRLGLHPDSNSNYTRRFKLTENGFEVADPAFNNIDLYKSDNIPFARRFNLNSDAGFNPCYINDDGKLILPDRARQYMYAKTSGVAIGLLGPQTPYDSIEIEEEEDDSGEYSTRIHEITYPELADNSTHFSFNDYFYAANLATATKKEPLIVSTKLTEFSAQNTPFSKNDALDIETADFIYGKTIFPPTHSDYSLTNKLGNAQVLFKTGESNIWIPIALKHSSKMVSSGFNKDLFDIVFGDKKKTITQQYKIITTDGSVTSPYIFDELRVKRTTNALEIALSGSVPELINIEVIIIGYVKPWSNNGEDLPDIPPCLFTGAEFVSAVGDSNSMSFHMRVGHLGSVPNNENISGLTKNYNFDANFKLEPGPNYDYSNVTFEINAPSLKNGSAVFSVLELDNIDKALPDQSGTVTSSGKHVLGEVLNELFRIQRINEAGGTLVGSDISSIYKFNYYKFNYLNLIDSRDEMTRPIGEYYVQLSENDLTAHPLSFLENLTFTAWRRAEDTTQPKSNNSWAVENTLPKNIKITEHDGRPVYIYRSTHNLAHNELPGDLNLVPKLAVRWMRVANDAISLRFDNATLADSVFYNENNNLNYISLANTTSSIELLPGNAPAALNIVSPIHIIAGNTVFTDIPLMTTWLTNVSDDKPKFMLSITDHNRSAESTSAYALVFQALSVPEIENRDKVMVQCYVSKLYNAEDQNEIPQINDAVSLSRLVFNMDISNVLNSNLSDSTDALAHDATIQIESIYGKTFDHIIKSFRQATATRQPNHSTIKVSIKSEEDGATELYTPYFKALDLNIDFHDVTKYSLKSALIGADTDKIIAIDKNGTKLYIAKVFACSFNKIGKKHVWGTLAGDENKFGSLKISQHNWVIPADMSEPDIPVEVTVNGRVIAPGSSSALPENVIVGKQADIGRQTAILVNPD